VKKISWEKSLTNLLEKSLIYIPLLFNRTSKKSLLNKELKIYIIPINPFFTVSFVSLYQLIYLDSLKMKMRDFYI
jgi:hypothetical protein